MGLLDMIRNGHPLEDEYGPIDAALIGAGATFNGVGNRLATNYYRARSALATNPNDAREYQQKVAAYQQDSAQNDRLYQPLTQAYPYATGIGESLPFIAGGYGAAQSAMKTNLADRWLQEVAKVLGYDPQAVHRVVSGDIGLGGLLGR